MHIYYKQELTVSIRYNRVYLLLNYYIILYYIILYYIILYYIILYYIILYYILLHWGYIVTFPKVLILDFS
jgi:hypothetical protein